MKIIVCMLLASFIVGCEQAVDATVSGAVDPIQVLIDQDVGQKVKLQQTSEGKFFICHDSVVGGKVIYKIETLGTNLPLGTWITLPAAQALSPIPDTSDTLIDTAVRASLCD